MPPPRRPPAQRTRPPLRLPHSREVDDVVAASRTMSASAVRRRVHGLPVGVTRHRNGEILPPHAREHGSPMHAHATRYEDEAAHCIFRRMTSARRRGVRGTKAVGRFRGTIFRRGSKSASGWLPPQCGQSLAAHSARIQVSTVSSSSHTSSSSTTEQAKATKGPWSP